MGRLGVKYLIVSLVLVLGLTFTLGCELLPQIETSPPPSPPEATTEDHQVTPINPDWQPSPTEGMPTPLPSIADVVAKVKPAVVVISTEVVTFDFFNRPFTQESGGSGWIISEDGIIITNSHVVEGARSITVTLDDGRTFEVDMDSVATDPMTDLAVLKVDAENLPVVAVGDSDKLRIGDWVVAIGNSLGAGIRATQGIVSRKDVSIQVDQGRTLHGLIETDAAINPGNSGGPLVNMAGEVIGITSVKLVDVEIEGVGYAISTKEAMPIITQLISRGYVVRPWLGVAVYTVDEFVLFRYHLPVDEGVLVTQVAPNSPASRAGLKPGDVIVAFEGEPITQASDLTRAIHTSEIGQEVEITFWRASTKHTVKAKLAQSPPPPR